MNVCDIVQTKTLTQSDVMQNPFELDTKPFIDELRRRLDIKLILTKDHLEHELCLIRDRTVHMMPDSYHVMAHADLISASLRKAFYCSILNDLEEE